MQQKENNQAATVTLRVPREDALRVMHLLRAGLLTPEQCSAEDLLSAAGMMRRLSDAAERLPKEIIYAIVRKYEPSGILQNMEPLNYVSLSADLDIALMVASTLLDGVLPESDALIHTEPQHAVERLSETNAEASTQAKSTTTQLRKENAPKTKETAKTQTEQASEEPTLDTLRRTVKDATAFVPNVRIAMLIKLFAPKPLLPEVPEDKRADLITLLHAATEYHRAASAQVPDAAFAAWVKEQQGRLERTTTTQSATAPTPTTTPVSLDALRASVKEAMSLMDNSRIAQMIKLYAPEPQLPTVPEDKRASLNTLLRLAIDYCRTSQVAIPDETWYEWLTERKNELDKE
jgi:hypothetical protein